VQRQALRWRQHIGVRLLVVDAKDESAKAFYERFGFIALVDTPMRLVLALPKRADPIPGAEPL